MGKYQNYILFIFFLSVFSGSSGQRPEPRVSGLENDSVYMRLLYEELKLRSGEDSVAGVIRTRRAAFSSDTTDRARRAAELLALEEELFQIRNNLGIIAAETNSIEQQYILRNLDRGSGSGSSLPSDRTEYDGLLYGHPFIAQNLPPEDYRWLDSSARTPAPVLRAVDSFRTVYDKLRQIEREYEGSETQNRSDSLFVLYRMENYALRSLESVLLREWVPYFDRKIYLFSMLLDRMNKSSELSALNEAAKASRLSAPESYLSPVLAEYPAQWALLRDYEAALARSLGVAAPPREFAEQAPESLAFPLIRLEEKEYAAYGDVEFVTPTVYDASNPIPPIAIPEQGTYYSVTVGTFANRTAPSVFRNAVPVAYERLPGGQWRYFVGLFRSYGEAVEAVETLKKAGFRRPEPVRWKDGKYENLAREAAANQGRYRLVLDGVGELSGYVREVIGRMAPNKEISRVGDTYYIGVFTDRLQAGELAEALSEPTGSAVRIEEMEP